MYHKRKQTFFAILLHAQKIWFTGIYANNTGKKITYREATLRRYYKTDLVGIYLAS